MELLFKIPLRDLQAAANMAVLAAAGIIAILVIREAMQLLSPGAARKSGRARQ